MSIPPLVCSTPPPLDQCVEDKEPEDFNIQYNLSQEDEDDNYDYGNFATYNHYQSSVSENKTPEAPDISKGLPNNTSIPSEITEVTSNGTSITSESKIKFEEEGNIEDLDLKVEEPTDVIENQKTEFEKEIKNLDTCSPVREIPDLLNSKDIPETIVTDDLNTCARPSTSEVHEFVLESGIDIEQPPIFEDEIEDEPDTFKLELAEPITTSQHDEFAEIKEVTKASDENKQFTDVKDSKRTVNPDNIKFETVEQETQEETVKLSDDEFGDFDDFQFGGSAEPAAVIDSCENPWDTNQAEDTEYEGFKASFDDKESNLFSKKESKLEHSIDNSEFNLKPEIIEPEDDDFGDFDDFKSSSNDTKENPHTEETMLPSNVPVLNLQSQENETQVQESIDKFISSIFDVEIPVPESQFESNLESKLSETWRHLLEVDTRQPYVVNWNNSLGQKTLLKALCIDSRNILFGPKWSYNMPKYAVNLSAAPLQPQKPLSASVPQSEALSSDKGSTKPSGTWSDPFASEGQELKDNIASTSTCSLCVSTLREETCHPESGNENNVIEPTGLDVFETAIPAKPDKIFSATPNLQPLRQINLPDTHIFTPTDSETPRSKTIHYDNNPTVLMPQAVLENNSKPSDNLAIPSTSTTVNTPDKDDYWEFQDFKGNAEITTPNNITSQQIQEKPAGSTVTYGSQMLQPVKVDPIIPTLNWPDPGEVKETFDDFSDFVSSTPWNNNDKTETMDNSKPVETERVSAVVHDTVQSVQPTTTKADSFDDEFDTFQSAPPKPSHDFNFSNFNEITHKSPNLSPQVAPQNMTESDTGFSKFDSVKSDTISFPNKSKSNVNFSQIPFPNNTDSIIKNEVKSSPTLHSSVLISNSSMLQPISASTSSQSQHKSTQILQPLSLESYSQINWPNPGIDLQDLSRFNPVETLQSLKSDLNTNSHSKNASPAHSQKNMNIQAVDDDWGEFVSSKPSKSAPKKTQTTAFADDDEWSDFVSSPSVKPQNGLNTISLNVHTNLNIQKTNQNKYPMKNNQAPIDIPSLSYITPKSSNHKGYNDSRFQNL